MYGLAVMLSISTRTTSKNIDEIVGLIRPTLKNNFLTITLDMRGA